MEDFLTSWRKLVWDLHHLKFTSFKISKWIKDLNLKVNFKAVKIMFGTAF